MFLLYATPSFICFVDNWYTYSIYSFIFSVAEYKHNICSTYYNTIVRSFSSSKDNTVTITYVDPDGEEHPVKAEIGKHLLDIAHDNNIELEGMYVTRILL